MSTFNETWKAIPYSKEDPMDYELVKPVSLKALEEAGACERELHRFAFLLLKNSLETSWGHTSWGYSDTIHIDYVLRIASQCQTGIQFLQEHGFIKHKEPELKPCPFCGSKNIHVYAKNSDGYWYMVECSSCGSRSASHHDKKSAIETWNKRSDLPR